MPAKMKKFRVSADEVIFYMSKEVEDKNKKEAEKKYLKMIENGEIEVSKSGVKEITFLPF